MPSARSPSGVRSRRATLDELEAPRRRADSRTPCSRRSASSNPASSTSTESSGDLARLASVSRASSTASGSGTATACAAGPSDGSGPISTPGRCAGLRLRLRGPDRRRVGAARGTRAARRSPSRCRMSRGGLPSPRSSARSRISRASPAAIEELARQASGAPPPALAHSNASCSRTTPRRARRSTARSASSRVPGHGVPSSSSQARSASLLRGGTAPERVGVVCESVDRWRVPLEGAFVQLGIPLCGRARTPPRRHASAARCLAAPLRVARGQPGRPLRVPPLAVLGYRASLGRLPGGQASRTCGRGAGARRGGVRAPTRRASRRAASSFARRRPGLAVRALVRR